MPNKNTIVISITEYLYSLHYNIKLKIQNYFWVNSLQNIKRTNCNKSKYNVTTL